MVLLPTWSFRHEPQEWSCYPLPFALMAASPPVGPSSPSSTVCSGLVHFSPWPLPPPESLSWMTSRVLTRLLASTPVSPWSPVGTSADVNHTTTLFCPKPSLTILGIQTEIQADHGLVPARSAQPLSPSPPLSSYSPFALSSLTTRLTFSC